MIQFFIYCEVSCWYYLLWGSILASWYSSLFTVRYHVVIFYYCYVTHMIQFFIYWEVSCWYNLLWGSILPSWYSFFYLLWDNTLLFTSNYPSFYLLSESTNYIEYPHSDMLVEIPVYDKLYSTIYIDPFFPDIFMGI
jgi:hypothetical protein